MRNPVRIFSSFSSRRVVVGNSRNRPPHSGQSRTSTACRLRARRLRPVPPEETLHRLVAWTKARSTSYSQATCILLATGYTTRRASRDLAMDGESEKRWGGAYQDQEREGGRRGPPLIATLAQKVAHSGKWRRITVTSKCARIDSLGSRSSPRALPQRPGLSATDRQASSTVAFVRC